MANGEYINQQGLEMAYWILSTTEKKSCEDREVWAKNGHEIVRISGFRWGTFSVTTTDDNPPPIDTDNPKGINMYEFSADNVEAVELISMEAGWYSDVRYPVSINEKEQERLTALWDDYGCHAWDFEGWERVASETWLYGPIEMVKQEVEADEEE